MALPFEGLRVVALEQAVAGPFCSRQFADLGADVIKIERPDGGDFARHYDGAVRGLSAHFIWLNRGKRSLALDVKSATGKDILWKLLRRSDVFVHNLSPCAVERLGFGYDAVHEKCPRVIWCGISGYGDSGPYRDRKAYDMLIQAEAGVMSLTGTADHPAKAGVSIADISAGLYAYSSIATALFQRERTGEGQRIDISMLECLTEWAMPQLYAWYGTGQLPQRAGMRHATIVPYGAYRCRDGMVNLAVQNDVEWRALCAKVLFRPELADDPLFVTVARRLENRAALETIIEELFADRLQDEIAACLASANIATGVLNDMERVFHHPQLAARARWGSAATSEGPVPALLSPFNLSGQQPLTGAVPELGQHTNEILAEVEHE
ncbi:MAG: CoA transferase [Candidatus Solibacter usitatus]|nr:CoA transferase [Candidatus Solibacter usitatus]